jgi:hypothetical protein
VDGAVLVRAFDEALPSSSRSRFSGVVRGATHAVPKEGAREDLIRRVGGFLGQEVCDEDRRWDC